MVLLDGSFRIGLVMMLQLHQTSASRPILPDMRWRFRVIADFHAKRNECLIGALITKIALVADQTYFVRLQGLLGLNSFADRLKTAQYVKQNIL
jgi:hypothetical protein